MPKSAVTSYNEIVDNTIWIKHARSIESWSIKSNMWTQKYVNKLMLLISPHVFRSMCTVVIYS